MSVLAGRGDGHGSGPVEIHVTHFVRQHLHLVRVEALRVVHHVVTARAHGPLPGGAGDEEEVVAGKMRI